MDVDPAHRAILDARARRLAVPMRSAVPSGAAWLEFALGRERHVIEATLVCGTFRFTEFGPLPGAGRDMVGMSQWRGSFLRILDLQRVLGRETSGLDDRAMVIALGQGVPKFGLLVGELFGVRHIAAGDILPLESAARFVTGVTRDAVQLLDGGALLRTYG